MAEIWPKENVRSSLFLIGIFKHSSKKQSHLNMTLKMKKTSHFLLAISQPFLKLQEYIF